MDRKIIASELYKIAKELLAESDYIYDPDHKKHPSGGYTKTEKGWTKNKKDDNGSNSDDNRKYRMTNQQIQLDDKSKSENVNVRKSVAKNSLSSRETLDRLSKDSNGDVRKNVAINKNTSMETLDRLSKDDDWGVRKGVAQNQHADYVTLDRLSRDEKEDIRMSVAKNPHTHEQTLYRMTHDETNKDIKKAVHENIYQQRINGIVEMMMERNKEEQVQLLEDLDPEERKDIWKQYNNEDMKKKPAQGDANKYHYSSEI